MLSSVVAPAKTNYVPTGGGGGGGEWLRVPTELSSFNVLIFACEVKFCERKF